MNNKIFYKIKIGNSSKNTYLTLIKYLLENTNIEYTLENDFAYYTGIKEIVISIDSSNKEKCEKVFSVQKIEYENISDKYQDYLDKQCSNNETNNFTDEDIIVIKTFRIPQTVGGRQLLNEKEIMRNGQDIVYIHSNEQSGHNIPHVHVKYNGDKNFCTISLIDFSVLQSKKLNFSKMKEIIKLVESCCDEARLAWNNSSSIIKFVLDNDGKPTNRIYNVLNQSN